MSCCNQPMVSNSVNIGVDPRNMSCSSIRVNIPLNYCRRVRLYGRVINNCNGSSVSYAKLQLLQQDPCTGCYRCIGSTTSDCRGMYNFNLTLHRGGGCSNYKIIASAPLNYNQGGNCCNMGCPQGGSVYSYGNYNGYNGCGSYDYDDYESNMCTSYNDASYNGNTGYTNQSCGSNYNGCNMERYCGQGNCCGNNSCDCGEYTNVQELQDSCPNYQYGYIQNICSSSNQGNSCNQGSCCTGTSTFWNDL